MCVREGLADLADLSGGLLGPEVDGGAYPGCAELEGLLDRAEHDLVEPVGQGQQFVVVQFGNKRDAVGVATGHRSEDAKRGGHRVTATLDGQFDDSLRIKVPGIRGKGCGGRMFDPLVDGQDRDVAGTGQAAVVEEGLEVAQDLGGAIRGSEGVSYELRAGCGEHGHRDAGRLVFQEVLGLVAEQGLDIHRVCSSSDSRTGRSYAAHPRRAPRRPSGPFQVGRILRARRPTESQPRARSRSVVSAKPGAFRSSQPKSCRARGTAPERSYRSASA